MSYHLTISLFYAKCLDDEMPLTASVTDHLIIEPFRIQIYRVNYNSFLVHYKNLYQPFLYKGTGIANDPLFFILITTNHVSSYFSYTSIALCYRIESRMSQ